MNGGNGREIRWTWVNFYGERGGEGRKAAYGSVINKYEDVFCGRVGCWYVASLCRARTTDGHL